MVLAMRGWLCVALLSFGVCIVAGCGGKENPPNAPANADERKGKAEDITLDDLRKAAKKAGGDFDTPPPKQKPPESLADVKADMKFTIEDIETKYKDQQAWYDDLWKNHTAKVVELTVVIEDFGFHLNTLPTYFAIKAKSTYTFDSPEPWKKAFPGQTITVRARINPDPPFGGWQIVEVRGPKPVEFTAEQIAKDLAADPNGFEEKYKRQHLVVSGVIEKVNIDERGHATVTLKSPAAAKPITCLFLAFTEQAKERNKLLKVGATLKAIGRYEGRDDCTVRDCQVLEQSP